MDELVVSRGLAESRTKAQALIMAGSVMVRRADGAAFTSPLKAGTSLPEDSLIELEAPPRWVSRSGGKLEGALEDFGLTGALSGVWLDTGASTGGFTEVLLTNGVTRVYAVDVGRNQLAAKLRSDPRIVIKDGVNSRALSKTEIPEPLDGATLDLSFISVRLVIPAVGSLLKPDGRLIVLHKPQFEGERRDVSKGGIVRDDEARERIRTDFTAWCGENGWMIEGSSPSRVTGREGNQEHFFLLRRS